jgi:cellulose synthase/poly-beta-1,6-N-acetylglucosamine synthase-like glycosyltransferase
MDSLTPSHIMPQSSDLRTIHPRVSIIIPARNEEAAIGACLNR